MKSFIAYKSCPYKPFMSEARLLLPAGISLRPCSPQWVQDPPPNELSHSVINSTQFSTFGRFSMFYCWKQYSSLPAQAVLTLLLCCLQAFTHLSLPASSVPTSVTPHHLHTCPSTTAAHVQPKTQLLRQRQGKKQLRAWCKNQGVPGCSAAEPHGRMV